MSFTTFAAIILAVLGVLLTAVLIHAIYEHDWLLEEKKKPRTPLGYLLGGRYDKSWGRYVAYLILFLNIFVIISELILFGPGSELTKFMVIYLSSGAVMSIGIHCVYFSLPPRKKRT